MEAVSEYGLQDVHIVPDLDGGRFVIVPSFYALKPGLRLRTTLKADDTILAQSERLAVDGVPSELLLREPRPWSPEDPFLYDLVFEVLDDEEVLDTVHSYAGLRKVHIEGNRLFLNNRPIYLRLVLDQGFYPDGIWTAPSDEALKRDIELSLRAGFNGARLHQKVFEPRFHYWADRLGYLTWGE
jgi:beta-galactosidase/beta-glucuronidase